MATVTTKSGSTKAYNFKRVQSNASKGSAAPKSGMTIRTKPTTTAPTAGSFGNKSTRTRYFSTSTGQQISRSGRKVAGGRTSGFAKTIGKTPQAKAALGAATTAKSRVKLPHADKRTAGAFGKAVNHSPILVAEFLVAMVIIGFQGISSVGRNGYQSAISGIMLRFSAVTAIWFILFLFASSKRGGTFAAWFGFLIILGILFDAVRKDAIKDMSNIISGQGIGQDTKLLVQSEKPPEFYTEAVEIKSPTLA
jgi:hypothetical protein